MSALVPAPWRTLGALALGASPITQTSYVDQYGLQPFLGAYRKTFGRDPSYNALIFGLAQAWHEASWGRGWKPPCDTSYNWGAVQSTTQDGCDYTDSSPNGRYAQKFVVYPSNVEGAAGYLRQAYVRRPGVLAAAERGDFAGAVRELYRTSYFTGIHCAERGGDGRCLRPDAERNIADYWSAVGRHIAALRAPLAELGWSPAAPGGSLASTVAFWAGAVVLGAAAGVIAHEMLRPRPAPTYGALQGKVDLP